MMFDAEVITILICFSLQHLPQFQALLSVLYMWAVETYEGIQGYLRHKAGSELQFRGSKNERAARHLAIMTICINQATRIW